MRALRLFGIVAVWLLLACLNAWAMAALYFDFSRAGREWLPPAIYLVVLTLFLAIVKSRVFRIGACFMGFFIVLISWLSLKPSNGHDWQSNLSQTPWAEIAGDRVTIHNFRHCYYREEAEFTCEWLTKEVFLSQVRGVDFFLDYWSSLWIAHPIISFQFGDDDYVAASIEARYQIGQSYSPIRSFFRQFTIIYVLASERDLIRLRTNYPQARRSISSIRLPVHNGRAISSFSISARRTVCGKTQDGSMRSPITAPQAYSATWPPRATWRQEARDTRGGFC